MDCYMYVVMSCGVLSHPAVVICSCGCGCSYAGSCTQTQVRSSLSFAPLKIQGPQSNSFFCSEGSVVIDFTMFFRGVIDPVTATAPLKQAIESGKLGDFSVSNDSFTVTSPTLTPPPTLTPTPTGGYNHTSWWSLRIAVQLQCTSCYSIEKSRPCNAANGSNLW